MGTQAFRGIIGFHLVTPDLPRLVAFYRDVLGCAVQGPAAPIDAADMQRLGLAGGGTRQWLTLGEQHVAIEQFEVAGQPCPPGGDAASLWFQHLALVVTDIDAAHARLRGITSISIDGPQRLPPSSGGARAFKFRDPDGHPLELLEFPASSVPKAWQGRTALAGQIALGIDHSAISVGDVAASERFYASLGLAPGKGSLNEGPTQQRLDGLPGVRVAVLPMQPHDGTPHLELLGYQVPRGEAGPPLRANDVAATRIGWQGTETGLLADPDGHLQQVNA